MPYFWYPGYLRGHWPSNFRNGSAFAAWVQEVMWAPWWTPSPETYPEPSETFKRELFVKIVNGWKPVTIFAKAFKVVKISQIYSNSRLILGVFSAVFLLKIISMVNDHSDGVMGNTIFSVMDRFRWKLKVSESVNKSTKRKLPHSK